MYCHSEQAFMRGEESRRQAVIYHDTHPTITHGVFARNIGEKEVLPRKKDGLWRGARKREILPCNEIAPQNDKSEDGILAHYNRKIGQVNSIL